MRYDLTRLEVLEAVRAAADAGHPSHAWAIATSVSAARLGGTVSVQRLLQTLDELSADGFVEVEQPPEVQRPTPADRAVCYRLTPAGRSALVPDDAA